ncbi:hypothetical protein CY34DRAFT_103945 [Suillus luteus UH-Slu-Lm8-n1]|uniref:Uncharacterized protein n=1 Tax=Suillus luteus UH-Slu-Lm8-n1 TaxID=930992 RepID=A0A0D0C104_9AGAM|nr:hypothetical protein CY34DRAFT_103945 [Suillus luteus UH-Slu-Lm8-n1]
MACCDREELYVKYGKAMAHLCIQPVKIREDLLVFSWNDNKFASTRSRFIRDAFMAGRTAYDQLKNVQEDDARQKHQDSVCTALRTLVVHGQYNQLSRPDDEDLIWDAGLQWRHSDGREPGCEEFDWLIDYLDGNTAHDTGPDASFHFSRDSCYIRLICALTKNDEWIQRLSRDGHLERCYSLVDGVCRKPYSKIGFYLLVMFGRIKSSGTDLPFGPAQERWRLLIANTWTFLRFIGSDIDVDGIPAFVEATRLNLTASDDGVPREWFPGLCAKVHTVLDRLQERQAILVDDGIAQAVIDAALSSIQGLYDDLSCMVMQRNTSQKEEEDRDSGL